MLLARAALPVPIPSRTKSNRPARSRHSVSSRGAEGDRRLTPSPDVVRVAPGAEAGGLGHRRRAGEVPRHDPWPVRVAAEGELLATGLVPPAHDHRGKGYHGVELKRAPRTGQRAQHGTAFVLVGR